MTVRETFEFNNAKAKALRLKAESHRWDARVCELRGDEKGGEEYRQVARELEASAARYEQWASEAPDAPGIVVAPHPSIYATPADRVAVVPVLDAPPAAVPEAREGGHVFGEVHAPSAPHERIPAPPPAAVPEVDWREHYRFQTAMRYMDASKTITRDQAYKLADDDVAHLLAAALAERAQGASNGL